MKIILGFTGLMASGKGTAAKYIEEKYGAKTYRFSTILRNLLDRIYLPHSRDNLIKMSEIIRGTYGEDTLARVMTDDVQNAKTPIIVVEGIRRMADIEYLKKLPNFILVEISADIEKRLERIQKRRENPDDATKTMEQFLNDHKRSTEISIAEVASYATEKIDNDEDPESLYKQLEKLIKKYNK